MDKGRVFSINRSKIKGTPKAPVDKGLLIVGVGLQDDAHAGNDIKQVSLLSIESIRRQKECVKIKKNAELNAGDFAENITTQGLDLSGLRIGSRLRIGEKAILEVSRIGKECHNYCSIYYKTGDCIMPKEGIFAKVIKGGDIYPGDPIEAITHV